MILKELLLKELLKNGYAREKGEKKVWSVANRSLLYVTPEQVKGFLNLREHPRYRRTIAEIEIELIKRSSGRFFEKCTRNPVNIIDMGCGDGKKARIFLESLKGEGDVRFCAVSPNEYLVRLALENVRKGNFKNVKERVSFVEQLDSVEYAISKMRNDKYEKNVVLLFGSILASFEIHDYLFKLSREMFKGDCLIIGNGIRVGERLANIENYEHSLFHEWLVHSVKELGFENEDVKYGARFANGRVECFYELNKSRKLKFEDKEIELRKGDEIIVAILYKYFDDELLKICKQYFCDVHLEKDKDNEYALIFCEK